MHLWHYFGQSQGATYVEAFADSEKDAGSTPATSTKNKERIFSKYGRFLPVFRNMLHPNYEISLMAIYEIVAKKSQ